jgi:hypothetical protein
MLATDCTIGQSEPEVKQQHRQAATAAYLTMTRIGGDHRTAGCGKAVAIAMTSATSLTTGGVSGQGHRPLHDAIQQEMSPHQGGTVFV